MKKIFVLMLLCATVMCFYSCEKYSNIKLENTIWKSSCSGFTSIEVCVHNDSEYCDNCYGWQTRNERSSYYVFRENKGGYYAYHEVKYWKNKEGAPYYNYPDKHSVLIFGVSYDCDYPNLYVLRSKEVIKKVSSIEEAIAYMKTMPLNISELTFDTSPKHYLFDNKEMFGKSYKKQ